MKKITILKAAIVGATGYTGSELVRILSNHPYVSIEILTSEIDAGKIFSQIHPQLNGIVDVELKMIADIDQHDIDVVFLALPHGISMNFVKERGNKRYKIIDLSGDFRMKSAEMYKQWYGKKHTAPGMLSRAVFGLPELFRDQIRRAKLIANPGCYSTSAILGLTPLLKEKKIHPADIIIDSKSGVSGAGAKGTNKTHFPELFGNFSAYALLRHRHIPEIQSVLHKFTGQNVRVLFTPHLLPIDRGILTTMYCRSLQETSEELLQELFADFYKSEQFIRIVSEPSAVKNVRGSNYCDIYVTFDSRTQYIIVITAIDNLVKGAAGQAVQNMNIMNNIIENTGLLALPLSP